MNKSEMSKQTKEQLIRTITALVVKELNTRGFAKYAVDPLPIAAAGNTANGIGQIPETNSRDILIDGIVTARKLEGYKSVRLAENSIVTPAARDYIKEKKIVIQSGKSPITQTNTKECADSRWLYWSSCSQLKSFELAGHPEVAIQNSSLKNGMDNLQPAIKALDSEIAKGQVKGGVLIVETSAKAAYLAHQYSNIRAVVGSFPKTVEEGIHQLAANVLILEHTYIGRTAIREMINQFVTTNRPPLEEILPRLKGNIR